MALSVNTNVTSQTVQKNLNKAGDSLSTSMTRLSSGLKINSAKDDAAGMQIANRLNNQVKGLNVAIANANNGLVIGTDHAAEAVMGFFTKFGDGACDLAPLSGLVKGQVRAIAAHLGAPAELVHKTPTADLEDLAPGRPDEAAYGVTYDQIDAFLHGHPVDPHAFQRIVTAYEASGHKRAHPLTP